MSLAPVEEYRDFSIRVTARVGKRYRTISEICRSTTTADLIHTCDWILRIFSSKYNSTALRQELDLFKLYNANDNDHESTPESTSESTSKLDRKYPYSFIDTCLLVGTSFNPQRGAHANAKQIPSKNSRPNRYLIFDITDITDGQKPRYCFFDAYGRFDTAGPLSAREFGSYYVGAAVRFQRPPTASLPRCDDFETIDLDTLYRIFPGYRPPGQRQPSPVREERVIIRIGTRSLVEQTLQVTVDNIPSDEQECDELLEPLLKLEDIKKRLRQYLAETENAERHSHRIEHLLSVAFAGEEHVNLTPWPHLSMKAISNILRYKHVSESVQKVSISSPIGERDIRALGEALPQGGIEDLYLLSGPRKEVWNPEGKPLLLDHSVTSKVRGKIVFDTALWYPLSEYSLLDHYKQAINFRDMSCPVLQVIYKAWDGLKNSPVPADTVFLGDVRLSPIRLVTGLFNWFHLLLKAHRGSPLPHVLNAALAFASGSPTLEVQPYEFYSMDGTLVDHPFEVEVSSLPGDAFTRGSRNWSKPKATDSEHRALFQDLHKGTWTVLVSTGWGPALHGVGMPVVDVSLIRAERDIEAKPDSAGGLEMKDLTIVDLEKFLGVKEDDGLRHQRNSLSKLATELWLGSWLEGEKVPDNNKSLVRSMTADAALEFFKTALLENVG